MTFYVIGNGFDQHYGLKTSYIIIKGHLSFVVHKLYHLFLYNSKSKKTIYVIVRQYPFNIRRCNSEQFGFVG